MVIWFFKCALVIIIVGANLPHIAEYISIGNTKDEVILDSCKDNNGLLLYIEL